MVTIKDIARELGLSVSSVSMALNNSQEIGELTKRKVQEKARELNYIRNGSAVDLQRQRTNTVLFITEDPARPYFADAIKILEEVLNTLNLDLVIITANNYKKRNSLRFLREQRADAVVCWSEFVDYETLNMCASDSMPIFVLGRNTSKLTNPNIYNVSIERSRAGYEITKYLIMLGFKNLVFVHNVQNSIGSNYRRNGFERAVDENTIVQGTIVNAQGSDYDSGYQATQKLLLPLVKNKQIDCIVYSTDDMAAGGLNCMLQSNIKIPDDVSITGYSNYPISKMLRPKLTTVELHEQEIMRVTAEALKRVVCKQESSEKIKTNLAKEFISSEIIERESVKRERK